MKLGILRSQHVKKLSALALVAFVGLAAAVPAQAIPILQVFIEGAVYDADTESWVTNQSNLKLWVIGNVEQFGTVFDVNLAAAYLTHETGNISISPTTTSLVTDPSVSAAPVLNNAVGADGTIPVMSDGKSLGSHGIYGPGVSFTQWGLGDFNLMDSPVGDFVGGFPSSFPRSGQINAYDISVSGYSMVHFDAFDHVESAQDALFAPFSHDGETGGEVPEPGSIMLLGLGLAGFARYKRKRSQQG